MSEYDAFGRKKDEAGLSDLGWGTTGDPSATPNQEATKATVAQSATDTGFSTPTEFTSVPTGPPPMRRRRGRNPIATLVQFLVLAGIGLAIYFTVDAGKDTVDKVRGAIDDFNGGFNGGGKGNGGDDTVPDQVAPRKLFTADGLRSAVRVMAREAPGKLTTFAIRRDRINATVSNKGKGVVVNFPADAEVPDLISTPSVGSLTNSFSYEEINYAAPARLIKAANARVNKSAADVDYVVAQKFTGTMQWGVYYQGGSPIVQGDSQGRYLRRIS